MKLKETSHHLLSSFDNKTRCLQIKMDAITDVPFALFLSVEVIADPFT